MTHNNFKRARLAAAIALISSTTALTGCKLAEGDSSTSTTITQAADRIVVKQQQVQKAQIVGIVQDTNGNPVANATVSIGIKTVKTNSNGAYYLEDIPVSGLNDILGGNNTATPLEISVVAPSGDKTYLNATVSVVPSAATIIQAQGGVTDKNTEDSLIALVQQDGLAISAGVTVVPEIKSTVIGVLLDNETGQPVPGATIGLDVLGVNGIAQQQIQNAAGANTSYGVATYQAATNDDGEFEFTNLPVDTEFAINIDNYTGVNTINNGNRGGPLLLGGDFDTTPEATVQNIGDISAKKITSVDDINPFVLSVSEVRVNGLTGLLKNGIDGTQGLTINFSEPVVTDNLLDAIYIKNNTAPDEAINISSATLSPDGKTLTVATVNPIAKGVDFSIYLNQVDFNDGADNNLDAGPPTFNDKTIARYDYASNIAGLSTVELQLKTYSKPVLETGAAVDLAQLQQDGGLGDFSDLQTLNATFVDIDSGSLRGNDTGIEQLNSKAAEARLQGLAAATYADAGLAGPVPTVDTTTARVQFTLDATTPSRNYVLELKNSNGINKDLDIDAASAEVTVDPFTNGTNQVEIKIDDGFSGQIDLIVKDATADLEHGDELIIASVNDFGVVVAQTSITLQDEIAPTTVVQSNYGLGHSTSAVVTPNYGDGGELAANGTASFGTPLFNVTAALLTPQASTGAPLSQGDTWSALTDNVERDSNNIKRVSDVGLPGRALYDATAWNTWVADTTARTRNVGIAFSEGINLTATPSYNGAANLLSNWSAQNGVVQNSQAGLVSVDLANVEVSDIVELANNNHNTVIDFTGAVADLHGNAAAAGNNAKVVVRDSLPPLPTSAVYTGDTIVITFNEDLGELDSDSVVTLETLQITGLDDADNASVSGNTLTVNSVAWGTQFLNKNALFSRGTYDHDGNALTPDANHGAVTVSIPDMQGNTWLNAKPAGIDVPAMVIRDEVGAFTLNTLSSSGLTSGSTAINLTLAFGHRIDLQSFGAAAGATTLSSAQTAALFNLTSGASIDTSNSATQATLDASGKVLTVSLQLTSALASGDTLDGATVVVPSVWDGAAANITTLLPTTVTIP